ncbi:GTPase-associated protein 1-related protein [Nocardiopsis dassonvillei]|uniref:GTPase-associated protein 1-related protein n=1 Tax=Nocardiopsis dassonvillei TaxID=2014 RepID=UPI00200F5D45|nr:GTPase-associated protein 1-related protein [Nocardiopsis dassonvillei]MCK9874096.1 GTPase-associated protein 1-related protein [Nocardiopsis dassonvillei]
MGFAQLYYTSCEHGLSGYAGYQFNAATPGVDPRVLREVERFTVYEPPRSRERVDEHPVNLCYSPDVGGVPVVSRVVSSGDDPSGRPGNYFAHSLVAPGPEESGPLPAELWEADFWAEEPVGDPGLSELAELSAPEVGPGPLDRPRTDAWVRSRPAEVVTRLLLAADDAVDDSRPLVLVADSASVAHWVAALSHLLPPRRARLLSFATYCGDPDEALVQVVGVAPDSDTALWRTRFTVYDPEQDPPDALPEPDPRARAVADRLVRLGTRRAAALWHRARPYASGREGALADWLPVLAAASLLDAAAPAREDLREVREWLPEAVEWLAPGDAAALVHRILDADAAASGEARVGMEVSDRRTDRKLVGAVSGRSSGGSAGGPVGGVPGGGRDEASGGERGGSSGRGLNGASGAAALLTGPSSGVLDTADLAGLQRVAHRLGGADGTTERLEHVMVRRSLDDIAAGGGAPAVTPMRTESVRGAARERVAALLDGECGELAPDRAVVLLRWARASGLPPCEESMERYGGVVLAPLLASSHLPSPEARALVAAHPGVRRGAAAHLASLPRERLSALAAGPVGALFANDRDGSSALLRELRLLATDPRSDLPGLLSYLVSVRREGRAAGAAGLAAHDLDEDLLTDVWGPGHGPRAALLVLRVLRPGVLVAPGVGGWVAEAMAAPPGAGQERPWRELVDEVSRHWLRTRLPDSGRRVVMEWSEVRPSLVALRAAGEDRAHERLAAVYAAVRGTHPAVEEVAWRLVVRVLLGWCQCSLLAEALRDCPARVFEAYGEAVSARLADDRPDTATAALVYRATRHRVLAGHGRAGRLDASVLAPAVGGWRRRHLARMRRQLPRESAAGFDEWAQRSREPRGRGFLGLGSRSGERRS